MRARYLISEIRKARQVTKDKVFFRSRLFIEDSIDGGQLDQLDHYTSSSFDHSPLVRRQVGEVGSFGRHLFGQAGCDQK